MEKNELDLVYEIIKIAERTKKDAEEVLRNNKSAGVRVRKKMQIIRDLCVKVREKIQERKHNADS